MSAIGSLDRTETGIKMKRISLAFGVVLVAGLTVVTAFFYRCTSGRVRRKNRTESYDQL